MLQKVTTMNDLERLRNAEAAPVITSAAPFNPASVAPEAATQITNTADSATSEAPGKATKTAAGAAAEGSKAKPKRKPQSSASSQFKCGNDGVWFRADEESPPVWVCARLDVLEQTRDETDCSWGKLIRFSSRGDKVKELNLLNTDLGTEGGGTIIKQLEDAGLRVGSGDAARRHLVRYLREQDPPGRALLVSRAGWHADVFLLGSEQIGTADERRVFAGRAPTYFALQGSLNEWRDNVAALCAGNSLLLFAMSVAFNGPLLEMAGAESGGYHLWGASSAGKTTILQLASSVYGKPAEFMQTWNHTPNQFENVARACNHLFLPLDEMKQAPAKAVGDIVYCIGNSKGKGRMNGDGGSRQVADWLVSLLSTGEITLEQHMASAGEKTHAGQEIRLLSIPLPDAGLFVDLHHLPDGAAFSNHIKQATAKHYGTAGRAYLNELVAHKAELPAEIRAAQQEFITRHVPTGSHGQVVRTALRFALVGFAGELATRYGITAWQPGTAMAAAVEVFRMWLKNRGTAGSAEDLQYLRRLSGFFGAHGEGRFTRLTRDKRIDEHAPKTLNSCGYRWIKKAGDIAEPDGTPYVGEAGCSLDDADEYFYYVHTGAWSTEIFAGMNVVQANKVLVQLGIINPGKGGKSSKVGSEAGLKPIGCTSRVYEINAGKLAEVMAAIAE